MTSTIFSKLKTQFENDATRRARASGRAHLAVTRAVLRLALMPLLCCPLLAQAGKATGPTVPAQRVKKQAEAPVKYADIQYRSAGKKDPFFNPLLFKAPDKKSEDEEVSLGVAPPGIAGTFIAQAILQGVAMKEDTRVAIIRGNDSRAYFLKPGDKLFDGYLKEIGSDSITLVRETRLRSGKVLTQDVTKRLRTP